MHILIKIKYLFFDLDAFLVNSEIEREFHGILVNLLCLPLTALTT